MEAHEQFKMELSPNKNFDNMILQDITLVEQHLAFGV